MCRPARRQGLTTVEPLLVLNAQDDTNGDEPAIPAAAPTDASDAAGSWSPQDPVASASVAPKRLTALQLERVLLGTFLAPEFRPVFGMVAITLAIGTVFYRVVEGWGLLDALYFSVVTLATIGFGDEVPVTRLGKVFTIIYVFVGVGTLGVFLSAVARSATRQVINETRDAGTERSG